MDSVTQILLGAAIGEAGFRSRLGWRAPFYAGLLALGPDLDLLIPVDDWLDRMQTHRAASHSLIVLTLASPFFGWLGHRFGKKLGTLRDWTLLAFLALITHPLLDWCTSYGTQLFSPLTTNRYANDAIGIVDPFYSVPLLVAVLCAIFLKSARWRWRIATAALIVSTLYLGAGYGVNQWTTHRAHRQLTAEGLRVKRIRTTPALLTVCVQRVAAELEDGTWRVGVASVFDRSPLRMQTLRDDRKDLAAHAALQTRAGTVFDWFSQNCLRVQVDKNDDGSRTVLLHDMRYGMVSDPTQPMFAARIRIDATGSPIGSDRVHGPHRTRDEDWPRREWHALLATLFPGGER